MSGIGSMARRVSALSAEIQADRGAMEQQLARVQGALESAPWPVEAPMLSVVAVSLHHYYSAGGSVIASSLGEAREASFPERC